MTQKVIQIPRINDGRADFATLLSIWSQANDYFEDIRFDFSGCNSLRPNAVAFLGGLARLIESRLGRVVFDWDTLRNNAVLRRLVWILITACKHIFFWKTLLTSRG